MRWLSYFILAYLTMAAQIGLADLLILRGAKVNLVLIAAVFIAVNAPREAALIGCFVMGMLQDLLTQNPPGLHAFAYGLTGLAVVGMQPYLSKDNPIAHMAMTLLGGVITAAVVFAHSMVVPIAPAATVDGVTIDAVRPYLVPLIFGVIFTTLAAAPVSLMLMRLKSVFAFQQTRRRVRAY